MTDQVAVCPPWDVLLFLGFLTGVVFTTLFYIYVIERDVEKRQREALALKELGKYEFNQYTGKPQFVKKELETLDECYKAMCVYGINHAVKRD